MKYFIKLSVVLSTLIFPLTNISISLFGGEVDAAVNSVVYEWTNTVSGTSNLRIHDIDIDGSSNIYATGYFFNIVDLDPTLGVDNRTSTGNRDVFVIKYDSNGNYLWGRTFGGVNNTEAYSISVNSTGNVHVIGYFEGTVDFDWSAGVDNKTSVGGEDIFVTKLDSSGNYQWTNTVGSTGNDVGRDVDIDSNGNIYATGEFVGSIDFDPGPGTDNVSKFGSNEDLFITKYDSSGNYQWTRTVGGGGDALGNGLAVDSTDNVYVTGYFEFSMDFDGGPGVDTKSTVGGRDIFLTKYDSSGNYQYTNTFGSNAGSTEEGLDIVVNGTNVYLTGYFLNTVDFDPTAGVDNETSNGSADIFVSKYNTSGSYQWTNTIGGSSFDRGYGITADSGGVVV